MMHGLALWFALAGPLDDVAAWRHLPPEKVCEENYKLALDHEADLRRRRDFCRDNFPWHFSQVEEWYWHADRESQFCRMYWLDLWWVTCSQEKYQYVTWEARQVYYARARNTERCACHELRDYVGIIPAIPPWTLERR